MKTQNLALEQISERKFDDGIQEEFRFTKNFNSSRVFSRSYPNLQYFCPKCGMLDVILDLQNSDLIIAQCLDCKNRWTEEYLY